MKYNNDLTEEYVRSVLDYNPETGIFVWRVDKARSAKRGQRAGGISSRGYRYIRINGKKYLEHRLAYLVMVGDWPKNQIDHEDRIRSNNKWVNLRLSNQSQNNCNAKTKNKTGYKCVYKSGKKWMAVIRNKDLNLYAYLGSFLTKEEAALAYNEAAKKYYGKFAALNEVYND
jgi:hypothetical protein